MTNDTKFLKKLFDRSPGGEINGLPFHEFLKVVRSFNSYYGGKDFNVEPLAFHGRFLVSRVCPGIYLVLSPENPREHYIFNVRRPGLPMRLISRGENAEESPYCWISAYSVTREFGGHEEGGWWWDCYAGIETVRVEQSERDENGPGLWDEIEARLINDWRHLDDGRDLSSVLSTGQVRVMRVEDDPFEFETTRRPRYE